ncbi:SGNH/GDSL hydrolase family protein [Arthrobacter sp. SLBN-83]|uniref:SGNH/GDSL hydrolase family protein n=1 Tax=Arthrobacter sp. SLBN-83 TaxID=2768449 RepID=UPI00135B035E|nr:SGNH/GDSL hydrolase family protein [Arthrobacter sp. SLBN-83]
MQYTALAVLAAVTFAVVGFVLVRPEPVVTAQAPVMVSPSPTPTSKSPLKIWFTGDSLTKGLYASAEANGFARVATSYLSRTREVTASYTSEAGANLAKVASNYPIPSGMDVAVVELGTNDAGKGTKVADFEPAYADYLAKIKQASPEATVICLGIWGSTYNNEIALFNTAIEKQCSAAGGRFIPVSGIYQTNGMRSLRGDATWAGVADDFHPSDTGHAAIANAVTSRVDP